MLQRFLNFTPQTRPACQVVLQTPSKSLGLTELPSRQQFACISPLAATLMDLLASVANKRLTARLTPLAATLTKNRGRGVRSRFGPLNVLSLPLYFHTSLLHLFSSPGVAPHDPAAHIQPPAHPQGLDRQRAHRKDSRPPREKLHRHHRAGRNLQLPRSAVRPHLFHPEGRSRAGSLRLFQAAAARHQVSPRRRPANDCARFDQRLRIAWRVSDLRGKLGAHRSRRAPTRVRAIEEAPRSR